MEIDRTAKVSSYQRAYIIGSLITLLIGITSASIYNSLSDLLPAVEAAILAMILGLGLLWKFKIDSVWKFLALMSLTFELWPMFLALLQTFEPSEPLSIRGLAAIYIFWNLYFGIFAVLWAACVFCIYSMFRGKAKSRNSSL